MAAAQQANCKPAADFPMNGFANQLSRESGAAAFAEEVWAEWETLNGWINNSAQYSAEQNGKSPFPPTPMQQMLEKWRRIDSNNVTAADAKALADVLSGPAAKAYFDRRIQAIYTLTVYLDKMAESLTRMRGSLTGVRNMMTGWEEAGLIARTVNQMSACATACAAPALDGEGRLFGGRYEQLSRVVEPMAFETASRGVMLHWQHAHSRVTLLTAYYRQYQSYIEQMWNMALARGYWLERAGPNDRALMAFVIAKEVDQSETEWLAHQTRSIAILKTELQDRRAAGWDTFADKLFLIRQLLHPEHGLRQAILAYRRDCG